jgi:dTDP-4-amino-4,6-dideoxygalactose transaminase
MYYLLLPHAEDRARLIARLAERGIHAVWHYVPLHSSPAGKKFGRTHGDLRHTDSTSDRLLRLPLWVGMTIDMIGRVVDVVRGI